MSLPPFLRHRDPDEEHNRAWAQRAYDQRGSEDRRPRHYLTLEDALEQANEVARLVLPEGEE
jgi:hypothetical protein